ncbi:MAG: hypothetical protein ACE5I8_08555 [Thermodesulfobacteriota bacterium]
MRIDISPFDVWLMFIIWIVFRIWFDWFTYNRYQKDIAKANEESARRLAEQERCHQEAKRIQQRQLEIQKQAVEGLAALSKENDEGK